jgi:hypothetical protein
MPCDRTTSLSKSLAKCRKPFENVEEISSEKLKPIVSYSANVVVYLNHVFSYI